MSLSLKATPKSGRCTSATNHSKLSTSANEASLKRLHINRALRLWPSNSAFDISSKAYVYGDWATGKSLFLSKAMWADWLRSILSRSPSGDKLIHIPGPAFSNKIRWCQKNPPASWGKCWMIWGSLMSNVLGLGAAILIQQLTNVRWPLWSLSGWDDRPLHWKQWFATLTWNRTVTNRCGRDPRLINWSLALPLSPDNENCNGTH